MKKKKYCIDCNKQTFNRKAKRCKSCSHKGSLNINFGGFSEQHIKNLSKACKGRPSAFKGRKHTIESKKRISDKLKGHKGVKKQSKVVKHHTYLRENSSDIIKLSRKLHGKLHHDIYRYLYETQGKKGIDLYLEWFWKKYKVRRKK